MGRDEAREATPPVAHRRRPYRLGMRGALGTSTVDSRESGNGPAGCDSGSTRGSGRVRLGLLARASFAAFATRVRSAATSIGSCGAGSGSGPERSGRLVLTACSLTSTAGVGGSGGFAAQAEAISGMGASDGGGPAGDAALLIGSMGAGRSGRLASQGSSLTGQVSRILLVEVDEHRQGVALEALAYGVESVDVALILRPVLRVPGAGRLGLVRADPRAP